MVLFGAEINGHEPLYPGSPPTYIASHPTFSECSDRIKSLDTVKIIKESFQKTKLFESILSAHY